MDTCSLGKDNLLWEKACNVFDILFIIHITTEKADMTGHFENLLKYFFYVTIVALSTTVLRILNTAFWEPVVHV